MHSGDASSGSCRDPNYDTIALSLQTSLMLGWRWCEEVKSQNRTPRSYCMVWIALPTAHSAHPASLWSVEIRYGWAGDARYSVFPFHERDPSPSALSFHHPFLPSLLFKTTLSSSHIRLSGTKHLKQQFAQPMAVFQQGECSDALVITIQRVSYDLGSIWKRQLE